MRVFIRGILLSFLYTVGAILLLFALLLVLPQSQGDEATDKALEAAYIQTGAKADVDLATRWGEKWANDNIVNKSSIFPVGLGAYWVYRLQKFRISLKNGNSVTLYQDHADFNFKF